MSITDRIEPEGKSLDEFLLECEMFRIRLIKCLTFIESVAVKDANHSDAIRFLREIGMYK